MSVPIRSLTVLPAVRENIELLTSDGLRLVGELAVPLDRPAKATLIALHPLPTHGGYMDSHLLRKAAWRLPALADIAVLRFNTRGTRSQRGTSDGVFDGGRGEKYDLWAALAMVEHRNLPAPWLLGWSFGTEVALMHGRDPRVAGAFLLSPPLHRATDADLDAWASFGRPLVAMIPGEDDYLRPAEAKVRFARVPQAQVVPVEGGKHLWVGEPSVQRVLNEIVAQVRPEVPVPLPTVWSDSLMTVGDPR